MRKPTERIIDVNLNRLSEGLKVAEDVIRFAAERPGVLRSIRSLRVRVGRETARLRQRVISNRRSEADPGRAAKFDRTTRKGLADVLSANFRRAEEASRVLEEILKVAEPALSGRFKAVRFRLYDLEKRALCGLDFSTPGSILATDRITEERCPKTKRKPRCQARSAR